MYWQQLIIDRLLTKKEIIKALAYTFDVTPNEIFILKNFEDDPINDSMLILCQTAFYRKAAFPLGIDIFLRNPLPIPKDDIAQIRRFCSKLQCSALVSDDSVNPFSHLLVSSSETIQQVFIDLDAYDDPEEYNGE